MKVAVVCPYAFDVHGGVQDQVARIVDWLGSAGHEAWAVAPGDGGPPGTRHLGRYVSLPANRSRAPISITPWVTGRVRRAVEDADVVHIHEPFMPMVSLSAVLTKTPPKVGTFHAAPSRMTRTLYRVGSGLLRRVARRLDAVTAVSEVAAAAIGSIAEPVVVPNGTDVDLFRADGERVPGRVAFVGRDDERKGLDVLLAAWSRIAREHPAASLHVVGASRRDREGVSFLGRVSEDEKRHELEVAEIFVAPNRGGESFGMTLLEGLAAGCAVVASDLAAFRAVAGDAVEYTPVGDVDSLAEAVVALLGAEDRRSSLSRAGVERAALFGRERVLGGYLAAYETAIEHA